jgi:sarcosine oxidase subunit beta
MTIDFASGFYFHREGPGLLFGTSDVCDTQDEWLERAVPVLRERAPLLLDAPIAGGWWGDYEMTPDHNALIGESSAAPGRLLYATGFSGHGFQQAPAVGEIVRDLYLGREPFVDVSALAAGRPERPERNVV